MTRTVLLAIDVGNTNVTLGLFDYPEDGAAGSLAHHWRITTRREQTSDEVTITLRALFEQSGRSVTEISDGILSSVVPPLLPIWERVCEKLFDRDPLVVGPGIRTGMPVRYENPREVGADRIVNSVAAYEMLGGPVIAVDFGTATTFDVVDEGGSYCGGAIAPGINLSLEALHRAAAKLPRIAVEPPENVIGTSTVSAMQSGVFWGYVGLIEGLVVRIQAEFGKPMSVIGTGGLAPLFVKRCSALQFVDRDLTMAGLLHIYELNRDLIRSGKGQKA